LVRYLSHPVVPFVANQTQLSNLNCGLAMRELYFRLQGQVTVSGDGANIAHLQSGEEWGLVEDFRLISNATDVIREMSGPLFRQHHINCYGRAPLNVAQPDGFVPGTTVVYNFDSTIMLPLWQINANRPIDTMLDTQTLTSLTANIAWGDADSIVIPGAGTAAFTVAPTLEIYSLSSSGFPGRFNMFREQPLIFQNVAQQAAYLINLPVTAIYRGILIYFQNQDSNDPPNFQDFAALPVGNVQVKSGPTLYVDSEASVLQAAYNSRNKQQSVISYVAGAPATTSMRTGQAFDDLYTTDQSVLYIEFVTDGFLNEGIDTFAMSQFTLQLEVLAAIPQLTVLPLLLYPNRTAVAASSSASPTR
jgi:hypothetical protein